MSLCASRPGLESKPGNQTLQPLSAASSQHCIGALLTVATRHGTACSHDQDSDRFAISFHIYTHNPRPRRKICMQRTCNKYISDVKINGLTNVCHLERARKIVLSPDLESEFI